jgi:DNA polymerase III delta subunit
VLAFELQKMAMLAAIRGKKAITKDEIRDARAELVAASVGPVLDAIRTRHRPTLIKTLTRLRQQSKHDPTMLVTRVLTAEASKWLQAASLDSLPPKAAAASLGINAWYFEQKILPTAKSWGRDRLIRLLQALALSERGVLDGHLDPWIGLCCRLLACC